MQNMSLSGFLNLKHQKLTNCQFWGAEIVFLDKGYLIDCPTNGRLLEAFFVVVKKVQGDKNLRGMKT